ncbi:MAG: sugar ABC transporter permease [Anaerolineaceae bacterium]|nr:MAG: sugar ABC transporter permease [Anaerolineaceae bacterium]
MTTPMTGDKPAGSRQTKIFNKKQLEEAIAGLTFMAPAMLIFLVFLIVPIGFALYISLTDWNGITPLGQRAQAASGLIEFTNETDEAAQLPAGTRIRGLSEREVVTFIMPDSFILQAGESVTTGVVLTNVEQEPLFDELSNVVTVMPRNLRDTFELTNPEPDEVGNYVVTLTNISDDTAETPAEMIISSVGNLSIVFLTMEEATLPAGEGQTVQVPIIAEDESLGRATNLARNSVNIAPSELIGQISVNNPQRLEGGQNRDFNFIGLRNYEALLIRDGLSQRDFFTSVKNTVYFVLGVVPTQTFLALALAVIVNQRWLRAKGFFRTAFYFPSITSSVVISLIFMWMFTRGGLINTLIGGVFTGYDPVTWLNDPNGVIHNLLAVFGVTRDSIGDWAQTRVVGLTLWDWMSGPSVTMLTIMILNTWTTIGTMMIIFLAALQNIPSSVYEAASMDGASAWQTFRKITVPLLAPTTFFVVMLGLIGTFQVFDQIYVISSGGPAKTTLTIAYIVYQNGFNNSQMGLAAATALLLFIIIFFFTIFQRTITSERANI